MIIGSGFSIRRQMLANIQRFICSIWSTKPPRHHRHTACHVDFDYKSTSPSRPYCSVWCRCSC
ncbi:hypothetical protein DAI22_07g101200 [Oryza sativa Japonica Group]|nr:hypothetical protein DAI22_07g101200 [Oryza sativa Japonica Group]